MREQQDSSSELGIIIESLEEAILVVNK